MPCPNLFDWHHVADELRRDPAVLAWPSKALAADGHAGEFSSATDEMLAILDLLTGDPKWEVRRQVAELLPQLSEDVFNRLAARLTEDEKLVRAESGNTVAGSSSQREADLGATAARSGRSGRRLRVDGTAPRHAGDENVPADRGAAVRCPWSEPRFTTCADC
ncbi:MAG: hypothetical protein KatS3mg114_0850 [Planctomycetaceae bacterium]|nr:MAG: hypothetical protein KatS3mg114_0850 [Planctomycetaceae bacterium]